MQDKCPPHCAFTMAYKRLFGSVPVMKDGCTGHFDQASLCALPDFMLLHQQLNARPRSMEEQAWLCSWFLAEVLPRPLSHSAFFSL